MKTKISLIIPVYNTEKWLIECLDSVVNQELPFDEVILVNDGSMDNSYNICKSYANKFHYIKLISQENKGLSAVRNRGIESASGNYIMFLDSDDYLRKDTVKLLKKLLEKEQYDAIYFDADIHHTNPEYQADRNIYDRSNSALDEKVWNGWEYFFKCYPRDYIVSACMAVYSREIIDKEKLIFPEKMYYEDNYFSYRFLRNTQKVIHISEKLYQRRYRKDSIMTSLFSEKKFTDFINISQLVWEDIVQNDSKNTINQKQLLFSFISDHYIRILNNYKTCLTQNIELCAQSKDLVCRISEKYLKIFDKMHLQIEAMDLSDLSRLIFIFHHMECWNLFRKPELPFQVEKLIELQKSLYIGMLQKCLFDQKEKRIGIYGTGKHTEGVLSIYEKLIGKIEGEIIFVDTKRDNEIYKNRSVINYRKIKDQKIDLIIISSFIYEREMIRHVQEISLDIPIYTFYNGLNGDTFSDYEVFLKYC